VIKDWEEVRKGVRMCLRKLAHLDDRDDIEQDSMLRAFVHQDTYKGDSALSTWGYSIARNTALSYFKKQNRRNARELPPILVHDDEDGMWDNFLENAPSFEDTQEDALHDHVVQDYANALAAYLLDNAFRKGLKNMVARDLHEMSYDEIASLHNMPVNTVRSSISRARHFTKPKIEELQVQLDEDTVKIVIRLALEAVDGKL